MAAGKPELGASTVGDGGRGRWGMAAGEPALSASAAHPNMWELNIYIIVNISVMGRAGDI